MVTMIWMMILMMIVNDGRFLFLSVIFYKVVDIFLLWRFSFSGFVSMPVEGWG